jgi:DNA topoisomerase-1
MQICQKLYEDGYITYMRTDSMTYSVDFIETTSKYITKEYGPEYFNINEKNIKKNETPTAAHETAHESVHEEAHEAIRPTDITRKELAGTNDKKEIKMYALIRKNTLESLMRPAIYKGLIATVSAPSIPENTTSENTTTEYKYTTEQVVFPGWQIVGGYEHVNKDFAYLQTLSSTKNKTELKYKKITAKVNMKNLKSHYTEARLVQLLEQHGIGRPSTFSSLIDKIQDRNYVKKENIKGTTIKCTDFELEGEELTQIETEREFGNEKNKLVLQPLGSAVLNFLLQYFDPLFQYTYTKKMEESLDLIATGEKIWHELCQECLEEIDAHHQKMLSIQISNATINNATKTVNNESPIKGRLLGMYKEHEIILKNGKFGYYIEYGNLKKAVRIGLKKPEEVTLEEMIALLNDHEQDATSAIIRKITEDISIRKGKFGDYIFYKRKDMKKPQFLKLKSFTEDYINCDITIIKKWIKETYIDKL